MEMTPDSSGLQRFVTRAEAAETTDEVWTAAHELARESGFDRLGYVHHDPSAPDVSGLSFVSGFDPDWVAAYLAEDLSRVDPVPWAAMCALEPIRWSRVGELQPLSQAQTEFMDRLRATGGDGVAIQVFGPRQRQGCVGLGHAGGDATGDAEGRYRPARLRLLQAALQVAHLRVCRLLDARRPAPPALSRREREVLTWMARGKSNPAISAILGCSVHTVDTHVRRLFAKFDVGDRTSCVMRATGMGLDRVA